MINHSTAPNVQNNKHTLKKKTWGAFPINNPIICYNAHTCNILKPLQKPACGGSGDITDI